MNVKQFEVDSELVDISNRSTALDELRVTCNGVHTWYKGVGTKQLTEFKHALRALHNGARVAGRIPYYIIKER